MVRLVRSIKGPLPTGARLAPGFGLEDCSATTELHEARPPTCRRSAWMPGGRRLQPARFDARAEAADAGCEAARRSFRRGSIERGRWLMDHRRTAGARRAG